MKALGYALGEAANSLWRRRGSTLLAVVTITVAFFVLGVFLLLTVNAQRAVASWTEAAELSVYLADGVTSEQRTAVGTLLSGHAAVAATEFVSSEEAMKRFSRMFPELARAASTLAGQALPPSFEVRLESGPAVPPVEPLVSALRRMPGVSDVRYDREWVDRLQSMVRAVRAAGGLLSAVLVFAAALTVTSVVRLALHARRHEIEIMQLVGAPLAFIRGPFVMEGVLQGGIGALVALGLLTALFAAARLRIEAAAIALPGLGAAVPAFLPAAWIAALVAGGMVVGCVGGFVAARSAGAATDR